MVKLHRFSSLVLFLYFLKDYPSSKTDGDSLLSRERRRIAELNPRARGLTVSSGPISSLKAFALLSCNFFPQCQRPFRRFLRSRSSEIFFPDDFRFRDGFLSILDFHFSLLFRPRFPFVSTLCYVTIQTTRRGAFFFFFSVFGFEPDSGRVIFDLTIRLEQARSAWPRNQRARFLVKRRCCRRHVRC